MRNTKTNRIVSAFLTLFLLVSLLVSCSSTGVTSTSSTVASTSTSSESSSASTSEKTGLFANKELNRLVDQNHKEVEKNGWAELRIPVSLHGITEDFVDPDAVDAAKKLLAEGYEVYVVGGAIRDLIMDYPANDFDLATNASISEIKRILGDVTTHSVGDMTFAYAHYPSQIIDVAPFYNIPVAYYGSEGIPEFNPQERITDKAVNDSFRRDLTMNSIYYDMSNGDIVTWQGGLYDIREKQINTIAEPNLQMTDDPSVTIRALRFKARYDYKFSDRLEEAMRSGCPIYLSASDPESLAFNLPKLFNGGYATESYNVLMDYNGFETLFPSTEGRSADAAYKAYMTVAMKQFDALYKAGSKPSEQLLYSTILWPMIESEENFDRALEKHIALQFKMCATDYEIINSMRRMLRLEEKLTTEAAQNHAELISSSDEFADALKLLEIRALAGDVPTQTLSFWQGYAK